MGETEKGTLRTLAKDPSPLHRSAKMGSQPPGNKAEHLHFVLPSSWSAVSTPNSPPKGASLSQLQVLTQHTNLQGPPRAGPRLPGTASRELLTQCITGPLEWTLTHTPSSLQALELRSIEAFKEGQTVGKQKRLG